ncbi:MAG: hypothetical protein ACKOJF_30105 [Planctomycetaceae bacterium]
MRPHEREGAGAARPQSLAGGVALGGVDLGGAGRAGAGRAAEGAGWDGGPPGTFARGGGGVVAPASG